MKTWDAFYARLTLQLPDCPTFTVANAVRRAAINFYTDSRAWRVEGVALATTVASQRNYTVTTNPADAVLVGLPAIWINGDEADELPDGAGDDVAATDTSSECMVGVKDGATIRVVPAPVSGGLAIVATAAYAPAETAAGITDELYRLHHRAIEYLALGELKLQAGKPWSDPAGAMQATSQAESLVLHHSSAAGPIRRRASLRTRAV